MKRLLALLAVFCLLVPMLVGCGEVEDTSSDTDSHSSKTPRTTVDTDDTTATTKKETPSSTNPTTPTTVVDSADGEYAFGLHHAEIVVRDYGTIVVELDADIAPITVANFCKLANEGFYDGLTFHRVITGFMIQGGDPEGNGTGGSSEKIKGEFSANGVKNDITHTRGVISMARSQANNSASSQFFIVHQDSPHLNGQYAAFGHVTSGMDVVDAICENTPVQDANGMVDAADQPIITHVRILD